MKLEKFKEVTEQGCHNILQTLSNLDGNLTIKEITDFLTNRKKEAKNENDNQKRKIIEQVVGKYLFMDYSKKDYDGKDYVHNVLLHIESVNFISKNSHFDAELIGEAIILYKGEVRLETKLNTYSNYRLDDDFDDNVAKEISASQFEKIKNNHLKCLAIFQRLAITKKA